MAHSIKSYPFITKSQIKAQLASDPAFVLTCLAVLYAAQTDHEQDTKSTRDRNRRGFMSSHAVRGSVLAVKAAGEGLSEEETVLASGIVCRYTKQLAAHFRREEIAANPELAEAARVFSAE